MSSVKKESSSTATLDTLKLGLALLILIVALGGFYYFSESSTLLRVLGLLAMAGVSIALFAATEKGRALFAFLKGARQEVRKMVWPTRQEALQTTLIVMVLVVLVGIFLWLIDMLLGWGVSKVVGGA